MAVNRGLTAAEPHSEQIVVAPASDRSFGLVFAAVFAIIAAWPLLAGQAPRFWLLGLSSLFVLVAWLVPWLLKPLNIVWARLGELLHRVVTPVIMGIVFFLTVLPTGLIMRALGRDLLRLKRDKCAATYWINRQPPGPAPQSMTRQF